MDSYNIRFLIITEIPRHLVAFFPVFIFYSRNIVDQGSCLDQFQIQMISVLIKGSSDSYSGIRDCHTVADDMLRRAVFF